VLRRANDATGPPFRPKFPKKREDGKVRRSYSQARSSITKMNRVGLASVFFLAATCIPSLAHAVASAEVYTAASYGYGRFEARVQFAAGDGVISSFFLWKEGSEVAGTFWNELDFEKVGADCHVEMNSIYGNPQMNHIQPVPDGADACGEYHTYAYEWTPEYIAWFVDGVELRRDTGAAAAAYAENATSGLQVHFNVWPGDITFGGNFDPAILPVHQYVDWIQYSAYEGGAFTLTWREDFDSGTLPSGWGAANWGSPKNLSTHNPANANFINGFLVLSLTADDALGPEGAMPGPGSGSGGMGGMGGSDGTSGSGGTGGMDGGTAGTPATGGTDGTTGGSAGSPSSGGTAGTGGSAGTPSGTGGSMVPGTGGASGSAGISSTGGTAGAAASSGGTGAGMGLGGTTGVAGTNATGGTGQPQPADGCSFSAPGSHSSRVALGVLGLCAMLLGKRLRSRKRVMRG
jgi:endo-1,3-1,4-beta-glycanase ExoK